MAIWERFATNTQLTGSGSHTNSEILHNQEDTDNFQNADIVFVDGIVTIHTDTDDLCGVRFIVAHEVLTTGDLTEDVPSPDSGMVWYSHFVARGPLVFRYRSKKTLRPQHKLWCQMWKQIGSTQTQLNVGIQLFEQLKH